MTSKTDVNAILVITKNTLENSLHQNEKKCKKTRTKKHLPRTIYQQKKSKVAVEHTTKIKYFETFPSFPVPTLG